jgi:hypothetical protein
MDTHGHGPLSPLKPGNDGCGRSKSSFNPRWRFCGERSNSIHKPLINTTVTAKPMAKTVKRPKAAEK